MTNKLVLSATPEAEGIDVELTAEEERERERDESQATNEAHMRRLRHAADIALWEWLMLEAAADPNGPKAVKDYVSAMR